MESAQDRGRDSPLGGASVDGSKHLQVSSDVAKRRTMVSPRTVMADSRNFIVEKELLESQMRKVQLENSTLNTENKLLKDKYNRATARISELESRLASLEEELEGTQDNMASEISRASRQARADADRELEQKQNKISSLTRENDKLQTEIKYLQQKLDTAVKQTEDVRKSSERSRVLDAKKEENNALKMEISKLQELLEASEQQLDTQCQKNVELTQQVSKLTEIRDLLQLQLDAGGSTGTAAEKQVLSLEQRLRVTEERLTQERADRANNLSQVEEKLLSDNAKLQASEKELRRQLQREKDKNRNLEQRSHEYREENMKLRLALPDEDDTISSYKTFDIPNTSRSSHRQQTKRVEDVNVILKELEKEGVGEGEAAAIVALWNQREKQLAQLREWSVYLTDLQLEDKDTSEGLKLLREKLNEYEKKFKEMEEKTDDIQAEKVTVDSTYKQQLSILVKERHEAFARLKTLEDLMEALRKENELLRQGLATSPAASDNRQTAGNDAQLESLTAEIGTLESRAAQLIRKNKMLESELDTLKAQVAARDIALEEAYAEVKAAQAQKLQGEDSAVLKQKIDDLNADLEDMHEELKTATQRAEAAQRDKLRLEGELEEAERQLKVAKSRTAKHGAGRDENKDSKAALLEAELEQKDVQLLTLTSQLRQTEAELETTQQQLALQRETASALQAQVEETEVELQDRGEMLDTVAEKKSDLLEQLTLVKTRLDAASLALSQKQSQIQVLQMELAHEKERTSILDDRVYQLRRSDSREMLADSGNQSETVLELRIQDMESEITRLKEELLTTTSDLGSAKEECESSQQEASRVREEMASVQAQTCQLTSDKSTLEQELEILSQDHSCVTEERQQAEEHLVKMESRLQEVLHKFELEAKRQHGDFVTQYNEMNPEDGPKVLAELHALRVLTEEKTKETDMLNDKISRQELQARNMEKRVETLRTAQSRSKDDVGRLTKELVLKMKEIAATSEVNQMLVKEQAATQKEIQRLQQELEQERSGKEKRKAEISEVIRKVEKTELSQRETSQVVQQKDSLIAELEAEIRQVKRNLGQVEVENEQLKAKVDHLNEDIRNLGNVNTTLEKRLEMERASLAEERNNANKRREDLATTNHKMEDLKHEQTMLLNNLSAERKNMQKLKEEIQSHEEAEKKLQDQIKSMTTDMETQHGQLLACRQQIEQLKLDKEAIHRDYQDVCRQLGEKDHFLTEQQRQSDREVDIARTEVAKLMATHDQERGHMDLELVKAKEELKETKDQLRQKELQLTSFGRTLQELEDTTREKKELELKVERLEATADESRLLLESQRHEVLALKESNAQLQENLTKSQMNEMNLQDQLRSVRDAGDNQTTEMRHMLDGMKAHHEFEKKSLREALSQVEISLKSTEADLSVALEKNEQLSEHNRTMRRNLEEAQARVAEETAAHQLTQEKLSALKSQISDAKKSKFTSEEKMLELKASVARLEADLVAERDRNRTMACDLQEAEGAVEAKDAAIRSKHEQIDVLKGEVSKLQQLLESQKQQLAGRLRKSTLDLKQQLETVEAERLKLAHQAQQMSVELEQAREQLAIKNKENLKLQEEIVTLEDQVRENSTKLRTTQDSLKQEEEMQTKLSSRFQEQENELRKLRTFLASKADEEGDGNSMWKEMNRVMQELSRQMTQHMEEVRAAEREGREKDTKRAQKLRRELHSLESQLNAEKALHAITKSALQNLEEDCARLRQQIHSMRRKGYSQEKKQKTRMEEINEIIARSQTRAQAMMASGVYLDGTLKNINPSRDFNISTATNASGDISPDTSLALSDASFTSTGMFNNSFLNLSGVIPPGTPRK